MDLKIIKEYPEVHIIIKNMGIILNLKELIIEMIAKISEKKLSVGGAAILQIIRKNQKIIKLLPW